MDRGNQQLQRERTICHTKKIHLSTTEPQGYRASHQVNDAFYNEITILQSAITIEELY